MYILSGGWGGGGVLKSSILSGVLRNDPMMVFFNLGTVLAFLCFFNDNLLIIIIITF